MALALYRRYRPDTFDGVVGQDHVTKPLSRALDEGKLTHAYLFSGPRGCGKTSSARILARCINCVKGPTSHPCGVCDSCRDLATNGPGSIDVVEIDAASHGSVDDARELRERAEFAPARDRYKIFILDEAHMVTGSAFNALLKTVEEPPEHVMFIFATTEPDKVIGTIRSRTHHYPFRLVPSEIMQPYLEDICAKEGISLEPGVLRLAMRAGSGSMRDTLSVLDQLMVGATDGLITYEDSVALLGFTPDHLISEAIDAVIARDGAALYTVVEKVVTGGFDPRKFVEDLLAYVRDLLVLSIAGHQAESALSSGQSAQTMEDMQRQANELNIRTLNSMAEHINDSLESMSGTMPARMRLELLAAQLLVPQESVISTASENGESRGIASSRATARGNASLSPRAQARQTATQSTPETTPPQQPVASQTAHSAQIAPVSSTQPPVEEEQARGDVVKQSTSMESPAQMKSPTVHEHATQAPDAQKVWNVVVSSLPEKIRVVVNAEHIPHVEFQIRAGRRLMILTFAQPLSQHAFGLAVSSEPVNGETSLQRILDSRLQEELGEPIRVAPAPRTADGQTVTPMRDLNPAQRAQVKAQVAQMAAQNALSQVNALMASHGQAHGQQSHTSVASDQKSTQDDTESDGRGSVNESARDTPEEDAQNISEFDPWAQQTPSRSQPHATSHQMQNENSSSAAEETENPASVHSPEQPHSAHSSTDDNYDPWAQPEVQHEYGQLDGVVLSTTVATPTEPAQQQAAPALKTETSNPAENAQRPSAVDNPVSQATRENTNAPLRSEEENQPKVNAEEDNYSLQDAQLGSSQTMSVEDIEKMFNAKKVVEFSADDEKNPLNES
ncbi:DNA polymerase III subunit gamma/tau [Alloscardovia criceti]|uniref:DNA polymerase III subunit gamma/tau n=1 Tax=Alloscardovia criceti TaxID=356828 RepID=UPI000477EF1D|nr:DNA polymerase III subunit gamma/tau [Alloscardovia criceti]